MEYRRFDRIRARFSPRRTDDLQHDGRRRIGQTLDWEAGWVVPDGPYRGQMAWLPRDHSVRAGWVPTEDLQDIEIIDRLVDQSS